MVYMFLAEGFEEVEALAPLDLLRRAGIGVTTVGVGGGLVTGSHGIAVKADIADIDVKFDNIDMVILPGGMPGTKNLDASETVHKALDLAEKQDAYIAAICAAPMILGKRGDLKGKDAVCYPGFEEYLEGARLYPRETKVAIDGKYITARGMGAAVEFGLCLVAALCGKAKADELRHSVIAD
jgi:4-methyl-5(b-hydroxyethyl)-thiazole monophosphate biosynthesis